jgi:hypothetical protein
MVVKSDLESEERECQPEVAARAIYDREREIEGVGVDETAEEEGEEGLGGHVVFLMKFQKRNVERHG